MVRLGIPVLLVDNYDSYTYNLYQLIYCENEGQAPVVLKNDDALLRDMVQAGQLGDYFGAVVISPGPGSPEHEQDFGINLKLIRECRLPILGVCLGHQGIGHAFGAKIARAPEPMHGRSSPVYHCCGREACAAERPTMGSALCGDRFHAPSQCIFSGLENPFSVIRYHSLVVEPLSLISCASLVPTAWTSDGVSMGLQHTSLPIYGIQFHPESIATECGKQLVSNFLRIAQSWNARHGVDPAYRDLFPPISSLSMPLSGDHHGARAIARPQLMVHAVPAEIAAQLDSETVFSALYSESDLCYWLDSAKTDGPFGGRFSIMGHCDGSASNGCLLYQASQQRLHFSNGQGRRHEWALPRTHLNFMEWFQELNRQLGFPIEPEVCALAPEQETAAAFLCDLGFRGGWIGLFGYELHRESLPRPRCFGASRSCGEFGNDLDKDSIDAVWFFADRAVVFDHLLDRLYLIFLFSEGEESSAQLWLSEELAIPLATREQSQLWMQTTLSALTALAHSCREARSPSALDLADGSPLSLPVAEAKCQAYCRLSPQDYAAKVRSCQQYIMQGESYELCFTTKLQVPYSDLATADSFCHYVSLRRKNPAPFAFYFSLKAIGLHLCSASPEELLRVSRRPGERSAFQLQTKPIKGTIRRDFTDPARDHELKLTLKNSVKDKSENLMIVDLVRHDLGSVAKGGSVQVPFLFEVETYAVHQLVSTITAMLDFPKKDPLEAVWAAFPPGSMTGAPKQRSVDLLEALESPISKRGLYSGSAGWISIDGAAHLNVIIRTAVFDPKGVEIGAGGAIVHLSTPEQEYDEMILKASSVVRCLLFKD